MFDIGWPELLLIATIAIIVVGPKDLPRMMRTVGQYVGRARAMAREFQRSFEDLARETELEDLRKEMRELRRQADLTRDIEDAGTAKPKKAEIAASEKDAGSGETERDRISGRGDAYRSEQDEAIAPGLEEAVDPNRPTPGMGEEEIDETVPEWREADHYDDDGQPLKNNAALGDEASGRESGRMNKGETGEGKKDA